MREKGSVTVTFALVFLVLFGFIVSFFELASHVARASYHASASLLATENYFAAFLEPLYEEYHIFGREVSSEEGMLSEIKESIGEDVAFMTKKREGERSLLLRSGAEYDVTEAKVLTSGGAAGFYHQAATTMKYRGALEITELLKEFSKMAEQAEKHLEVAAAKAEADSAYGAIDERILHLIGLIDGVDIVKYEKFLGGKNVLFQKETYVKQFCTAPYGAVSYFDRTEVYQAFLKDYENPCDVLEELAAGAEQLAEEIEEREAAELNCRNHLAELRGKIAVTNAELEKGNDALDTAKEKRRTVLLEIGKLLLLKGTEEEVDELSKQKEKLDAEIETLDVEKEQWESAKKELEKEEKGWEKEEKSLEKTKKGHEKRAKALVEREEEFVKKAAEIRDYCGEAYDYVGEIQTKLIAAKKAKSACETVLNAAQYVIGEDAAKEYRDDLGKYRFYEDLEGYDFERMKQTLLENKSVLWNIKKQFSGTDAHAFRRAITGLREEKSTVENYSFEGLRLDYGEMSLEEDLYSGVESVISEKAAEGFLGFVTNREISGKQLDTSYLPSGFYSETADTDVFSLLGSDMSTVFSGMQSLLPEREALDAVLGSIADPVLFHSYLSTHFSGYSDEKETGALSYEQEYLIAGKDADKENLSSVAMRLCVIRTILHFVSLYTDSEKKAPVEQAALAACGAIGLPALKSIMVFLLLFVWALEEALVDTAALLAGKKVLLYPGKNGGSFLFSEILLFSKETILEKAEKKESAKGAALGYNEFRHLFLFLTPKEKKCYRALDLIQENLRESYRDSFRVNRCVWEISYRVDGKDYIYAYE